MFLKLQGQFKLFLPGRFLQQAVLTAHLGQNLHIRRDVHHVVVEETFILLLGSRFQIPQAVGSLYRHIRIWSATLL